jgi:hypothetical protein
MRSCIVGATGKLGQYTVGTRSIGGLDRSPGRELLVA